MTQSLAHPPILDKNIKLKIIIVDDSIDDHFFIKEALYVFKNISFEDFFDGEKFLNYILEKVKHSKGDFPDIVILDINMPKLNGFEVFEKVKQKDLAESIMFFILSTHITDRDMVKCKELQIGCYQKPFSVDSFSILLQRIIKDNENRISLN